MMRVCPRALASALLLPLAACSAAGWAADADAEVQALVAQGTDDELGDRAEWVIPVAERAPEPEAPAPEPPQPEPPAAAPLQFDLAAALRQGVAHNRDFQARREALYLTGLSTTLARFQFGPLFDASLTAGLGDGERSGFAHDQRGSFGVRQILPTGGVLALSGSMARAHFDGGAGSGAVRSYGTAAGITLTQPLLRGLGYEVSHEPLTQAERDQVYAIRTFELFRQDFSIDLARRFYDLASQKLTLVNEEENARQARFDREKAQALLQVDRIKEQDLFRARTREIDAEDTLIAARAAYQRALDEFKIFLGLPTAQPIEIDDAEPPFAPVRIDLDSAVRAARHNRLDLLTERERLEDARRAVRIAADRLLPDLGLTLGAEFTGADDRLGGAAPDEWNASALLTLEIPLQRKPERNAYRAALIALEQSERSYALLLDQLELDIRDQLRQIESVEKRILLQDDQIAQQEKSVAVFEIRYEAGELENRDLLEARQSLVDARNARIRLEADHFIRSLRLLRDLGLLFVEEDGMWR
jgi:outer membrane protein TolC